MSRRLRSSNKWLIKGWVCSTEDMQTSCNRSKKSYHISTET
ncbi:Uncharacterised protein [Vibrio cholerae]|nr:Uncharacterised protein [Vibrio cholerae]CSC87762.1 Uncharacterised protein [Vibrio cholerae]CSI93675.1 Uncharacterised protein [Vibrio cholerae]